MLKRTHHNAVVLRNARVIDPFARRDEVADTVIAGGAFAEHAPHGAVEVDASGWIICPGLMDIHVHLREPGQTHKETIATGSAAAAAGGFTAVACMPNTSPVMDQPDVIRWVRNCGRNDATCDVLPIAAITKGRKGKELTDFAALEEAGAVAFSDDGDGVEDDGVMLRAFEAAKRLNAVLIQHCEYKSLSAGGVMHKGDVALRLGLPGLDPRSEEAMIERDIDLCRRTGGRYHVAHISTEKAIAMVRKAKAEGLPVTAEVCTHHLLLTDQACAEADANTKMHPPLRPESDVATCCAGVVDGTIDCIVTDHAPHTADEKAQGFLKAPPGIVGLETALGIAATALIETQLLTWPKLIAAFTSEPARVLGLALRPIYPGRPADLTIINPGCTWTVDPEQFESLSRNTPFADRELNARAVATVRGDSLLYAGEPITADPRM